jgi:hypothetical protein
MGRRTQSPNEAARGKGLGETTSYLGPTSQMAGWRIWMAPVVLCPCPRWPSSWLLVRMPRAGAGSVDARSYARYWGCGRTDGQDDVVRWSRWRHRRRRRPRTDGRQGVGRTYGSTNSDPLTLADLMDQKWSPFGSFFFWPVRRTFGPNRTTLILR